MVHDAKGLKALTLPRVFNHASAKESTRFTGFNDSACGGQTRSYAKSAHKLENSRFEKIIKGAKPFMVIKGNRARKAAPATEVIEIDDDEDERACLVDTNSDDECKSFLQVSNTTSRMQSFRIFRFKFDAQVVAPRIPAHPRAVCRPGHTVLLRDASAPPGACFAVGCGIYMMC